MTNDVINVGSALQRTTITYGHRRERIQLDEFFVEEDQSCHRCGHTPLLPPDMKVVESHWIQVTSGTVQGTFMTDDLHVLPLLDRTLVQSIKMYMSSDRRGSLMVLQLFPNRNGSTQTSTLTQRWSSRCRLPAAVDWLVPGEDPVSQWMAQGAPLHPTGFGPARPANSYGSGPILESSNTTSRPPTRAVSEGTMKTPVNRSLNRIKQNESNQPSSGDDESVFARSRKERLRRFLFAGSNRRLRVIPSVGLTDRQLLTEDTKENFDQFYISTKHRQTFKTKLFNKNSRPLPTCTSTDRIDVFMTRYESEQTSSSSERFWIVLLEIRLSSGHFSARSSFHSSFSQQLQTFGSFPMGLLVFLQLWLFVKRLAVSAMFVLKDNEWSSLASNTLCRFKTLCRSLQLLFCFSFFSFFRHV